MSLLEQIQAEKQLSYLFIAHDLRVSCYFCDTIGVMYRGMLVEEAPAADLYRTCSHPYTKLLFSDRLSPEAASAAGGEVKTALESLTGCPFAHRCPQATARCRSEIPSWRTVEEGHKVRCFL